MNRIAIKALILSSLFYAVSIAEELEIKNSMVLHPEWYIKITDWSFYTPFRTAIIHHVTVENTSDITYKNIKVLVRYYATSPPIYGTLVSGEIGVLPITLPPHSRGMYLEKGHVLGAGSSLFYADNIEVLGATPVLK
ncbi:MAG TPA: hypothetical protein VLB01_06800 [Thermodesulfobacteriota bacterium]|nr:hypothetical protein [Thermodesulfobacteriota bacterium]